MPTPGEYAYQALTNLGNAYRQSVEERRAREERLADIAAQRGYETQVRNDDYKRRVEFNEQERRAAFAQQQELEMRALRDEAVRVGVPNVESLSREQLIAAITALKPTAAADQAVKQKIATLIAEGGDNLKPFLADGSTDDFSQVQFAAERAKMRSDAPTVQALLDRRVKLIEQRDNLLKQDLTPEEQAMLPTNKVKLEAAEIVNSYKASAAAAKTPQERIDAVKNLARVAGMDQLWAESQGVKNDLLSLSGVGLSPEESQKTAERVEKAAVEHLTKNAGVWAKNSGKLSAAISDFRYSAGNVESVRSALEKLQGATIIKDLNAIDQQLDGYGVGASQTSVFDSGSVYSRLIDPSRKSYRSRGDVAQELFNERQAAPVPERKSESKPQPNLSLTDKEPALGEPGYNPFYTPDPDPVLAGSLKVDPARKLPFVQELTPAPSAPASSRPEISGTLNGYFVPQLRSLRSVAPAPAAPPPASSTVVDNDALSRAYRQRVAESVTPGTVLAALRNGVSTVKRSFDSSFAPAAAYDGVPITIPQLQPRPGLRHPEPIFDPASDTSGAMLLRSLRFPNPAVPAPAASAGVASPRLRALPQAISQ